MRPPERRAQLSRARPESGAACSVSGLVIGPWSSEGWGLTLRESCAKCHLRGIKKVFFFLQEEGKYNQLHLCHYSVFLIRYKVLPPQSLTQKLSLSLLCKTWPLKHHLHPMAGNYETHFTWQRPQETPLALLPGISRAYSAPRKSLSLEQESPTETKWELRKHSSSKFSRCAAGARRILPQWGSHCPQPSLVALNFTKPATWLVWTL